MSEQWPVDLPVARVRIARPTDRLEEVVAFYRDGIGLPVIGSFEGHAGYSGIMLGLPGTNYHLEFTHYDGGSDCPAPSRDNLLVFYLYDRAAMDRIVERLRAMGYPTVPPENPSSFRKIVERLRWIRDLDLKPGVLSRIHHNRLQQLRREGERMTAQRLNQFDAARRDATLVSFLLATEEDLVDQALDMHEKLLGLHAKKGERNLLLEVDAWAPFLRHFTHLQTGDPAKDQTALLAALLGEALNLGPAKMAEACVGMTFARISWVKDWCMRDETYTKALAEVVNFQHQYPFAAYWGDGTTSSSDGQRFKVSGRRTPGATVNLRYGTEPGVSFYTHLSDQYGPYRVKVISATARDAPHMVDGLLYHETDLAIREHYTDTWGYTDQVFGIMRLLGFEFAPRIQDLGGKLIFTFDKPECYPTLQPLLGGTINVKQIEAHWDDLLRLTSSLRKGTVTASLILNKLASYLRQNGLAWALREFGRIERSIFALKWVQSPPLRRRVQVGLNKGEARNALSRAVCHHQLGEIRDRSYQDQQYRASGLNLVVAAIILWNTVYLAAAVEQLKRDGVIINDDHLQHLSPLRWEHINLTGDFQWNPRQIPPNGQLRPLRVNGQR